MVPGFTLRGEVDIGGMGSGFKNVFYEISTPIDEENTLMRWFFFRSFMLEPENDQEHLKRNLRNIFQDKANGESILPRRAPDVDDWPVVQADREDRVMTAYWQTLRDLRSKGWQIDRIALEALERDGQYRDIPSPGRARKASDWVFDGVPRLAANATAATRAKRGVA
jgi:hypothetical protein